MNKLKLLILMIAASVTPVVAADAFKESDKAFAEKVAVDGMTEVELGRIASKNPSRKK